MFLYEINSTVDLGANTNWKCIIVLCYRTQIGAYATTRDAGVLRLSDILFYHQHYISLSTKIALEYRASRSDSMHREKLCLCSYIFIHLRYIVMTRCIESLRVATSNYFIILI